MTLFINWGIKPFSMALLGWIFIRNLFSGPACLPFGSLDTRAEARRLALLQDTQGGNCA